ncbi:hypothetical protein RSAG8_05124, partial [Rhizoctonia solani AG-8 WAC10335]
MNCELWPDFHGTVLGGCLPHPEHAYATLLAFVPQALSTVTLLNLFGLGPFPALSSSLLPHASPAFGRRRNKTSSSPSLLQQAIEDTNRTR